MDYRVESSYQYDNNLGMKPEGGNVTSSLQLDLPLTFKARGERAAASVLAEATAAKYQDSGYDHDTQNIQGDASYTLERGSVSANAGYNRASTLDTEFLDTGDLVGNASRVDITSAGGAANYMLTEKTGVTAFMNYGERTYEDPRYQDFKVMVGYAGWLYNWTERTTLEAGGNAGRFENESNARVTSSSEAVGFTGGFNTQLSEPLRVSLKGGITQVESEYSFNGVTINQADDNNTGYSLDSSLQYEQERYQVSASLVRRLNPSGNGYLTETDQLDMGYRYKVSEHLSAGLNLTAGDSRALDNRIHNDRTYGSAGARLGYKLSPYWSVAGRYTWRYQDEENEDGSADSHSVTLSVIYHPEATVWSR